jgi:putative DNA primase/helicase
MRLNEEDVERGRRMVESGKHAHGEDSGDDPEPGFQSAHDQRQDSGGPVLYLPPSAPYGVAKQLYMGCRDADGIRNLLVHNGTWTLWRTTHWSEVDAAEVRSRVYKALESAVYVKEKRLVPWDPNRHKVANVLESMAAIGHLSSDVDAPAWIDTHTVEAPADQVISCQNGLLDLASRTPHNHTPALFNFVHVPFAYDPKASYPRAWLDFLASIWRGDEDSIALLQEYFGYVLSGRLDMQKMLQIIGPTRSGKGTIARILTALMGGRRSVPGLTLAAMNTNFGLSPLIGKPFAIIPDARLGTASTHTVVERLLSITGEDTLTIDRKYREPWTGKLPARFLLLSNELPRFRDSSGAIANRLLILQMTESFLGREKLTLDETLRAELPGILLWALEGLDRLTSIGRFTVPTSSTDAARLMMDLASPVSAFVRDCCLVRPTEVTSNDALFAAWRTWAEENGHHAGSNSTFGRDLRAAVPSLRTSQRTIDGRRVRCSDGIGVLITTYDRSEEQRVHPVHGTNTVRPCTGCGTKPDATNPLVNGCCTVCTASESFVAQSPQPARDGQSGRRRPCPSCGYYWVVHGQHRPDCMSVGKGGAA